ncbi:hypothetical protein barba126G_phanotate68 [Rheinheimera phage vB_RspM_barba_12-6G]|uniref:Uncharacterized protein n=4 Tax=Barbavirus TaxID=2733095 RepID=A0A4V1EZW6_9CAUD|nr:hypothetical protein Barba17S_gp062 [Rheinheimera phage vB_RspM_Barba17S]QNO02466.1 hypothetical protein barba109C_phanotate145 [Rheinheimera phage vB_RspM_barba_10-9C]QNO02721.1 hypothetical protein barba109E_phanotate73 [Rheinheimera phage vB_RspM_barba_10-9E]QNO03300.1 hypothetical protein barba109I_phanotate2 [Rheinheimera phage vB_RspM_barba_10-9I]QNO04345.1 hypothetical protein barba126D_phanotate68 [Rheinheimera phage vB_RspM_barba_12-6D]QNO04829.1 hypothetical protein barba126G_phan
MMKNNYNGRDGNGYQPLPKPPPPREQRRESFLSYVKNELIIAFGIMLFLLLYSTTVNSSELCNGWANQAEKIMTVRQEHMSLAEISTRLEQSKDIPAAAKPVFTNLIAQAYQVPIYNKIQDKLDVIKKFSENVLVDCLDKTAEKV